MTYHDYEELFVRQLTSLYPSGEARTIFRRLMHDALETDPVRLLLMRSEKVSGDRADKLQDALIELKQGKPLQYVTGKADFCGMPFRITDSVLIPRPETEEMVNALIRVHGLAGRLKLCDIGTGSGIIAVTLAKMLRNAEITAVDIDPAALALTAENAERNGTEVDTRLVDITESAQWAHLPVFDVVVSNPPYVRESEKAGMHDNVLHFEPHKALFVPDEDPLRFYRAIAAFCREHLHPQGALWLEINEALHVETIRLLEEAGFTANLLFRDFNDRNRYIYSTR